MEFQLFIHHRAYRKLAWRLLQFSTHWGKLPFELLSEHLPSLPEKLFPITLPDYFHEEIAAFVKPEPITPETGAKPLTPETGAKPLTPETGAKPLTPETGAEPPTPETGTKPPAQETDTHTSAGWLTLSYLVDARNAADWVKMFASVWRGLEKRLLHENWKDLPTAQAINMKSPDRQMTAEIVSYVTVLHNLKPVLRHLLSAPGASRSLAEIGQFGDHLHSHPMYSHLTRDSEIPIGDGLCQS